MGKQGEGLMERMMPFSAFSTVIANNRYASLGLVLMGILAAVNKFVGGGAEEAVVKKGKAVVRKELEVVQKWDEYAVSLEDFGEAVVRDSTEANVGVAVRGVKAEAAAQDDDSVSPAANGDTTTAKSEVITISTTESERTTTLTTQVEKPSKKKRKSAVEDPSSPPEESLSLLTQPWSAPASVPPSRSVSPRPKLNRSKKGDPNSRRKKKKRRERDEIDDLFAGL